MAALAPTSSATPSVQSAMMRSRVENARREADQAEADARSLRAQAQEQERVMVQARGRAQTLEKGANQNPGSAPVRSSAPPEDTTPSNPSAKAPPSAPPVSIEQQSTYSGVLASVFEAARPLLQSELSTTQKNVVKSSLMEATNRLWNTSQTSAQVQVAYGIQTPGTINSPAGQLLNTSA